MRIYPRLTVTEKAVRKAKGGHPWVFGDEVRSVTAPDGTDTTPAPGDMVDVYSEKDKYLGSGFYNAASKIRVRLISTNANDCFTDENFWRRRLTHAISYRQTVLPADFASPDGGLRLIFGDADHFPGWTVDRYGAILVSEILSAGIQARRELLYPMLLSVCREAGLTVTAIYERCTGNQRKLEGLDEYEGFWMPGEYGLAAEPPVTCALVENGVRYEVDFVHGQKTGFFLDQKCNRQAAAVLAQGRHVLDMFTHTGSFGLNCAKAGAASVESVDISAEACAMATRNAAANGVADRMTVTQADVFEMLRNLVADKGNRGRWDYIILDPPAFTKSRDTVKSAYRGYLEINTLAMRLLPRGGYLATCSCSHFMPPDQFKRMLHEAAMDANVTLRQIEERTQSPDHPILWNVPETEYLKFYLFQVE